jgi:hypothetical protein
MPQIARSAKDSLATAQPRAEFTLSWAMRTLQSELRPVIRLSLWAFRGLASSQGPFFANCLHI